MWLKRRPKGELGAPPRAAGPRMRGAIAALVVAGILLPLFGASLIVLLLVDRVAAGVRRSWA